jgi:hypothetical protein
MSDPTSSLAIRDPELGRIATLGKWLALSEAAKDDQQTKGASAALRLYYAEKLDLPPLATAELSVIRGRLVVGAKLLRALAARHGYRVIKLDSTDTSCTAALVEIHSGLELGRATFTIEDAKRAGLVRERSAWVTHPARMLWARASKFVIDDNAPEVSLGIVTEDEMAEIQDQPATDGDEIELYVSPIDQTEEYEARSDLVESADDPPPMSKGGLRLPAGTPAENATAAGQNR